GQDGIGAVEFMVNATDTILTQKISIRTERRGKSIEGTNHVLPTGKTARYNAGLSVSRFLKPLTYQRTARDGTAALAPAVERISAFEGLAAHEATATLRIEGIGRHSGAFDGTPAVDRD
ncbi:histidinol dehydrogenase, partial [Streptomyces sp. NPDC049879]|uniref:histidinol dehydrogenase n=1 Tax=Streptomyces sp. NPDC049879 TaxID=3365598 RepID=UPI0037BB03E9